MTLQPRYIAPSGRRCDRPLPGTIAEAIAQPGAVAGPGRIDHATVTLPHLPTKLVPLAGSTARAGKRASFGESLGAKAHVEPPAKADLAGLVAQRRPLNIDVSP